MFCHKQISVPLIRFLEFQRCGNFDPSRDFGDSSCVPANEEPLDGGFLHFCWDMFPNLTLGGHHQPFDCSNAHSGAFVNFSIRTEKRLLTS
jgi:hypothetical protein